MPSHRDLALLAGRLVLGGYLAAHGAQKLFGSFDGYGIEATSAGFDSLGLKPGAFFARVAGASELAGGALVVLGAGDPIGPVALAGTMAVATSTHRANGPFSAKSGYELPLTNMALALALWTTGPGSLSFDGATGFRLPRLVRSAVIAGAVTSSVASLVMVVRASQQVEADAQEDTGASDDEVDDLEAVE